MMGSGGMRWDSEAFSISTSVLNWPEPLEQVRSLRDKR